MTKANITQYSSTASSNQDIDDININEGCPASGLNNAIRSLMAHLKNVDTGTQALTALTVTGALSAKGGAVFNEASADVDFRVESNGNANMLFVDGGNNKVGIGNNNPNSFGSLATDLVIGTTSGEHGLSIVSGTGNGGRIQFADNTASPFRGAFEYDHANDKMIIYTAGSHRFSINAGGKIQTFNCTGTNGAINLVGEGGLSKRAVAFQDVTNGSEVGSIITNGSATAYNTSSDYRLKESITYDFDATSRLKQLKPARFNFKIDTDTTVDGFIAHEVSSIVPEAISGTKDAVEVWEDGEELPDGVSAGDNKLDVDGNTIPDLQSIDQSKLVPLLVKTIQELEARITALES